MIRYSFAAYRVKCVNIIFALIHMVGNAFRELCLTSVLSTETLVKRFSPRYAHQRCGAEAD